MHDWPCSVDDLTPLRQPLFTTGNSDHNSSNSMSAAAAGAGAAAAEQTHLTVADQEALDVVTEWRLWSLQRRLSWRRRLENIERQLAIEKERKAKGISPLEKARVESAQFSAVNSFSSAAISAESAELYPTTKSRHKHHRDYQSDDHSRYYIAQPRYVRTSRYVGLGIGWLALILSCYGLLSTRWIVITNWSSKRLGLFHVCNVTLYGFQQETCSVSGHLPPDWQRAIIALVIISALFNLLANILATIGLFTSPLPRKLYFYHSAAESYLTAGVACALGLVIYTVTAKAQLESDPVYAIAKGDLSFGFAFVLCWCSAAFLFISSVMMALDSFSHYFTCRSRNKGIPLSNIYCNPANATTSELAGMTDETTA